MGSRRRAAWMARAAIATTLMATVGACSTNGDDTVGSGTLVGSATVDDAAPDVPSTIVSSSNSNSGSASASFDTGRTTVAVISDTGVPGLDSVNGFCRSWSEFAGSFQALALASDLAVDQRSATRAEVAAAGAIIRASEGLSGQLPAELEPERDAFTIEFIGPMVRRAQRSVDELSAAGLSEEQITQLGSVWLDALVASGLDDADIAVDAPADLRGPLDRATDVVAASRPPIATDPSLISDASTPLTLTYLSDNCPDQGILAGNDVVDQP